jgi:hypothetical protein
MKTRSLLPDLPGIYGLTLFVLLTGFSGSSALQCSDTYWHIKVGKQVLEQGHLLRQDIFSHTAYGRPWVAHEWLSEVLMAVLYDFGGLAGVTLAFFLVAALSFTLICKTARLLTDDWSTSIAALLALPLMRTHLLVRPHMFTWLFGALTIYLLVKRSRWLWLLPVITALWANLHGGFVFGLFLQGTFWLGSLLDAHPGTSLANWQQALKNNARASAVLLLSLLASGLNPYGFELLLFPFAVSSPVFAREIGEWMSPDLQQYWYLRLWIVALLVLAAIQMQRTPWGWRLIVLFLAYQALGHARHMSIAALFTLPWVAMAIHSVKTNWFQKVSRGPQLTVSRWSGPVMTVMLFLVLLLASCYQPSAWQQFAGKHFNSPQAFSPQLVEFLKKGYPGERVLNEYSLGGLLLFSLDSPPKVFIDGRADMYGEEIFGDYVKIARLEPEFERLLEKYRVDWILFPESHPLIRYLVQTPRWQQVYTDGQVAILVMQSPRA